MNGFYGEKRERGGRRKKNKKRREVEQAVQDWDDIYDPSRPNNYEEYKHSDERIREIRDWKDKLYAHRTKRRRTSELSSDEDRAPRGRSNGRSTYMQVTNHTDNRPAAFAPPAAFNFAPPPPSDGPTSDAPPPPPPRSEVDMHETAEDAYARRMCMSQQTSQNSNTILPPPPPSSPGSSDQLRQPALAHPVPAAFAAIQNASVSRAAIRYSLPPAPADIPASQTELDELLERESREDVDDVEMMHSSDNQTPAPRSNRPGQAKFAERMMAKMGWSKGEGLGAKGEGITTALKVKLEKRKQKSDAEGGGFLGPGGKGTIIGGKRKPGTDDAGKFGAMSEVVVLHGMLGGMDVDREINDGLVQEIGEECGEKVLFHHPHLREVMKLTHV